MNSPTTTTTTIPSNDLVSQLTCIGLKTVAQNLDDFIARATKGRWSPRTILEEVSRTEARERARLSLERRLRMSGIKSFKAMADFNWNWPKKIERDVIERALTLDFIQENRNLILLGRNGLGKTMIAKNIAHMRVLTSFASTSSPTSLTMTMPPTFSTRSSIGAMSAVRSSSRPTEHLRSGTRFFPMPLASRPCLIASPTMPT